VTVRRLEPGDHELLRTIRLRGLLDAPDAFGSTHEREAAFTDDVWTHRLRADGGRHYVSEAADGTPNGLVAIVRDPDDPRTANLVGMWVDPTARGSGVADELVTHAIERAEREACDSVSLHVTEGNVGAERLYRRHGFQRTGRTFWRERDGRTEVEMARPLRKAP
jgi:ribosomal protein S18 acetylase RimI-like enzyme